MLLRGAAAIAVLGAASAGLAVFVRGLLPPDGQAARGVTLDGRALSAEAPHDAIERAAAAILDRKVSVKAGSERLFAGTVRDLGATIDVARLEAAALGVARGGDLLAQVDAALDARANGYHLRTRALVPVDAVAAAFAARKEELDSAPIAAKLDVVTKKASPHKPGRYLDAFAAAELVQRAVDAGGDAPIEIDAPVFEIAPAASSAAVQHVDVSTVVSRYETRFGYLGGQQNRAQNVNRAASQMEGVVIMPGETISFNAEVGPRSVENGFATAPEIYKGEMREGIGGGTCQVAGTLHAAAYLGGLEIVERANHSRPSGYIRMGLDATVVYPIVDLRLKNPFDFPVVLHAKIDKGVLEFQVLGRSKPATVDFATETVGTADFKRKVEERPGLPDGQFRLKQKGIRGFSIRKTRTMHMSDGSEKTDVIVDVYPPTFEIYQVPPGFDHAGLPEGPPEKVEGGA